MGSVTSKKTKTTKTIKSETGSVAFPDRPTGKEGLSYLDSLSWSPVTGDGAEDWSYCVVDVAADRAAVARAILAASGFVDENGRLLDPFDGRWASFVAPGQRKITNSNVDDLVQVIGNREKSDWRLLPGRGMSIDANGSALDCVHRSLAVYRRTHDGRNDCPPVLTVVYMTYRRDARSHLFGSFDGVQRLRAGADWYSIQTGDAANASLAATTCQLLHGRLYGGGFTYSAGAGKCIPHMVAAWEDYLSDACTFASSITERYKEAKTDGTAGLVAPSEIVPLPQIAALVVLCDMADDQLSGAGVPDGPFGPLPFGGAYADPGNWWSKAPSAGSTKAEMDDEFPVSPPVDVEDTEDESALIPDERGNGRKVGPWGRAARTWAVRVTWTLQQSDNLRTGGVGSLFSRATTSGESYAEPKRDTAFADRIACFATFTGLWAGPRKEDGSSGSWIHPSGVKIGRPGKNPNKVAKKNAEGGMMPRLGGFDLYSGDRDSLNGIGAEQE